VSGESKEPKGKCSHLNQRSSAARREICSGDRQAVTPCDARHLNKVRLRMGDKEPAWPTFPSIQPHPFLFKT